MRGSWVRVPARSLYLSHRPGAEIGRQAWLRAMCPLGRAGSTPALGTKRKREPQKKREELRLAKQSDLNFRFVILKFSCFVE